MSRLPELLGNLVDRNPSHLRLIHNVALHECAALSGIELIDDPTGPLSALARHQSNACAFIEKRARDTKTDACRTAGDSRNLSVQLSHRVASGVLRSLSAVFAPTHP